MPTHTAAGSEPPAASARRQSSALALFETALIAAGLAILFLNTPHRIISDGEDRYMALDRLLSDGTVLGIDYSMIGVMGSAPLWYLDRALETPKWWCARYNFFVFALGLGAFYLLLRKRVDGRFLRRWLLILVFGSMFPRHQMGYFGEVFTAVLASIGILAVSLGHGWWAWGCLALGAANQPACMVGLALVVLWKCLSERKWRYGLALLAAAALVAGESWLRRGHPLEFGYQGNAGFVTVMPYSGRPGFSYPLFFGVIAILFSFGKGLFLFAPGLLLRVRHCISAKHEGLLAAHRLWLCFLAGMILVYAKWWAWYGGSFWGPRFFLIASVPASLVIAARLSTRSRSLASTTVTLLALVWSFWVGLNGVVFDQGNLEVCFGPAYEFEQLCWFVPEFSVLFRPFVIADRLNADQFTIVAYCFVVCLYLAAPLIEQLVGQLVSAATRIRREYLRVRGWRF